MRKPQSPKQMQAACDRFDASFKVGDEVIVFTGPIGENPRRATLRTGAQVLGGHTPVVYLDGGMGCVALTHVRPLTEGPA